MKTLPHYADDFAKSQFLQEINIMKTLGIHDHIVSMLGCITTDGPVCLIVEFCSSGDLLQFLRTKKNSSDSDPIFVDRLLSFAWQIADGLDYIISKGYVHRDVAARNVLVHDDHIAKVGDFGLCRFTDKDDAYISQGGRLPVKWMAIECLKYYEFTPASDVWAYGVLLFELISLGAVPYADLHSGYMEEYLTQGNRMTKMEGCPENLYQIMLQCWKENPKDRPGFEELRDIIKQMLEEAARVNYLDVCPDPNLEVYA